MSAMMKSALGAALIAVAGTSVAQEPKMVPVQRPFGSTTLLVPPSTDEPAKDCDAACLSGLATSFMDALVKQDGSKLPWANRVGYAENGVKLMVGDGVWATITAKGDAPLIITDTEKHQAIWIGTIDEHGQPGFYALALSAQGDRIGRIETVIRRQQGRAPFGDPTRFSVDAAFTTALAKGQATPKPVMTGLAHAFFEAQLEKSAAPSFAKGCVIRENGVAMTGNMPAAKGETGDCTANLSHGLFKEYEAIRRSVIAVDEDRGIVVTLGARDLPAAETQFMASDGKRYDAEAKYPRTVFFMTLFKIEAGKIARVESIANEVPYLMPPPWRHRR